jgi:hypothetical protein
VPVVVPVRPAWIPGRVACPLWRRGVSGARQSRHNYAKERRAGCSRTFGAPRTGTQEGRGEVALARGPQVVFFANPSAIIHAEELLRLEQTLGWTINDEPLLRKHAPLFEVQAQPHLWQSGFWLRTESPTTIS